MDVTVEPSPEKAATTQLPRRFGLLQATALNMSNMIGIGPFITIPLLMSSVNGGGPQAMIGWLIAFVIAANDGMIWSSVSARNVEAAQLVDPAQRQLANRIDVGLALVARGHGQRQLAGAIRWAASR